MGTLLLRMVLLFVYRWFPFFLLILVVLTSHRSLSLLPEEVT
jgi:hypothetical protein